MKVLGITREGYSPAYIVEVSHAELERVFEKGYRDELPNLAVGQMAWLRDPLHKSSTLYRAMVEAAPLCGAQPSEGSV